jgi:hypothetical protein
MATTTPITQLAAFTKERSQEMLAAKVNEDRDFTALEKLFITADLNLSLNMYPDFQVGIFAAIEDYEQVGADYLECGNAVILDDLKLQPYTREYQFAYGYNYAYLVITREVMK